MALDMFIDIDGADGETADKTWASKKAIDVLAWSWALSNSGSGHIAGGSGAGKVNVQDLSFTHYIDAASPFLMLFCANGKHIPKAVLTVRKAGENPVEYVIMTLEEVLVTSVSTGGSGGEDRLTETVSLNFAKVKVEYQKQDKTGKPDGAKIPFSWDIKQNVKGA